MNYPINLDVSPLVLTSRSGGFTAVVPAEGDTCAFKERIMEIDGKITISIRQDKVYLEIRDSKAVTNFCLIEMSYKQFCRALGGLAYCPVDKMTVQRIQRVGKKMEHKIIEFPIPKGLQFKSKRNNDIEALAWEATVNNEGLEWIPDLGFSSQGSFFDKDGKSYARTTIRRWVDFTDDREES